MHTVELLEQAIRAAKHAGYKIRQEWLGGIGGGGCEIKGQKWIFVDLGLSPAEQLGVVLDVLTVEGVLADRNPTGRCPQPSLTTSTGKGLDQQPNQPESG